MQTPYFLQCIILFSVDTFVSILSKKTRFSRRKMLLSIKHMFGFYLKHSSETFYILRRIQRGNVINFHLFMLSTGYVCRILCKLEFYQRTFEKYSRKKFGENPSSGSGAVPCGRTDRQADNT